MTRIIDSHCHIYPEKIASKAVAAVDAFYEGLPRSPLDGTAGTLLSSGRAAGISRFVVHSVATSPAQVHSINAFIAGAQREAGGAFIGLGALHPDAENPRRDLEELLSLGLRGVKLHPDIQRFAADSQKALTLFALCQEYGVPVLVHAGDPRFDFSNPERLARVLRAFPRLKMIAAHLGGWQVWDRAEKLLSGFPNLMADTSSSFYWLPPERALRQIRAFGADRVLFGTDYPMWPPGDDLDYMEKLPLTREEKEKILWKNCAELYRISFDDREETSDA